MVNGVLLIVAAVLFAVVSVRDGFNPIFLAVAGIYLLSGAINLLIHVIKVRKMENAAKNAEKAKRNADSGAAGSETVTGG